MPDQLAQLYGPHTGVTSEDVERRARAAQDYAAGDTLHQPSPPRWEELPPAQQHELLDQAAAGWLAEFNTEPPQDSRPVNHYSASSPPFPAGADELRYWIDRQATATTELTEMATSAAPGAYITGRVAEASRWLEALHARDVRGQALATGREETAYWITWLAERAENLVGEGTDEVPRDAAAGAQAEAREAVRMVRRRQQQRATPTQWHRGSRGHVDALVTAGVLPDQNTLVDKLVVLATHDVHAEYRTIMTGRPDVVATLAEWTGQPRPACEQAVREAADHGLVDGRTPADVTLTSVGDRVYWRLLTAVHPSTTHDSENRNRP
jgi:hypothetical protein